MRSICAFEKDKAYNLDIFYSFLYETGYLTPVVQNERKMSAKIPNRTIKERFLYFMESYFEEHLDFICIGKCAKLFDELFITFESENVKSKKILKEICKTIEEIFSISPPDKINESCLHSILFIIASKTSCKFLTRYKVGIEVSDGILDIAIFNKMYCIILEAKFDKPPLTGIKHIIDMNYSKIFDLKKYFPNNVKRYILLEITLAKNGKLFSNALINSKDWEKDICKIY